MLDGCLGRKSAVQGVDSGDAVFFPDVTVSENDKELAVLNVSADSVVMLLLSIKVGQGGGVRGEVSDVPLDISVWLRECNVA